MSPGRPIIGHTKQGKPAAWIVKCNPGVWDFFGWAEEHDNVEPTAA